MLTGSFLRFCALTQANIPVENTIKYGIYPWANQTPLFNSMNGPSLDLQKNKRSRRANSNRTACTGYTPLKVLSWSFVASSFRQLPTCPHIPNQGTDQEISLEFIFENTLRPPHLANYERTTLLFPNQLFERWVMWGSLKELGNLVNPR